MRTITILPKPDDSFSIHGRGIRETTGNDHDFMDNAGKLAESFEYERIEQ